MEGEIIANNGEEDVDGRRSKIIMVTKGRRGRGEKESNENADFDEDSKEANHYKRGLEVTSLGWR
jgi:hypothetical protein